MQVSTQRLTVTTRVLSDPGDLLALLPSAHGALSWVTGGDGLVGWGEAARYAPRGPGRFADARRWWAEYTAGLSVHDEVGVPGTGPVAFASLAFADQPGDSVLIVPRVLVGRRDGVSWVTTVDTETPFPEPAPVTAPSGLRYRDGAFTADGYRKAVSLAVQRIRSGELDKVVLAHDRLAEFDRPLDERYVLSRLAIGYPSCWTYAVDGLLGATPEMLLRRQGDVVSARLLAGTGWPGPDGDVDAVADELLGSAKNRAEHTYGVESLVATLTPFCTALDVPAEPSVLRLPNVAHLCTDVRGTLRADTSLLELTARVHPTAAVGGTPTRDAVRAIGELEGMDRGRYAGPVGWLDARGNGEFGIALRCAQVDGASARLYAGGGIVADSDPDTEVAEAAAKFRAICSALGD